MRLWMGLSALFHLVLGAALFMASFTSSPGQPSPVSDRVMMVQLTNGIEAPPATPPPSHASRPSPAPTSPVEREESDILPSPLPIPHAADSDDVFVHDGDGETSPEPPRPEGDDVGAPRDAVFEAPLVTETVIEDAYRPLVLAALAREKRYPLFARQRGLEGIVEIAFTIHPDGRVSEPEVISSSRQPVLDQAALGMVKRLGSLPPPPEPSPLRFPARIQYRLDEQ